MKLNLLGEVPVPRPSFFFSLPANLIYHREFDMGLLRHTECAYYFCYGTRGLSIFIFFLRANLI